MKNFISNVTNNNDKHSFSASKYIPKQDMDKLRAEKRNFLKEFSSKYGYNDEIDQIREEEYPQLRSEIYLDHTGSTIFPKSTLINFGNDLLNNLYGNPHSNSASSQASSRRIEEVRKRILRCFHASDKDYNVIFTQNATAAIKLVGESFPWSKDSTYTYLRESHNSINGLRRFVEEINSGNIQSVTEDDVNSIISDNPSTEYFSCGNNYEKDDEDVVYNLFAYPAQCNYSGMRFPLDWAHKIKRTNTRKSKTLVLLDAAAYVPSSPLSLSDKDTSPDFVCVSFYKMFGYPTGLGALILKSELNPILKKGFFGGGTTDSVAYEIAWQEFSKDISARYEDGTVNFLNIIALDHAFDSFEKLYGNIRNVSNHVTSLNTYLSRNMKLLRHWNGTSVCKVNSDREFSDSTSQGAIFSFNARKSNGEMVGYFEIEKLANAYGIHIRAGNNCNPGSVARWNDVTSDQLIQSYTEGMTCSTSKDLHNGKLFGATRVSIGAMTTIEDILIWLEFFKRNYVEIMPGKTLHDLSSKEYKLSKDDSGISTSHDQYQPRLSRKHDSINNLKEQNKSRLSRKHDSVNNLKDQNQKRSSRSRHDSNNLHDQNQKRSSQSKHDSNNLHDQNQKRLSRSRRDSANNLLDQNQKRLSQSKYDSINLHDQNQKRSSRSRYDIFNLYDQNQKRSSQSKYDSNNLHDQNQKRSLRQRYDSTSSMNDLNHSSNLDQNQKRSDNISSGKYDSAFSIDDEKFEKFVSSTNQQEPDSVPDQKPGQLRTSRSTSHLPDQAKHPSVKKRLSKNDILIQDQKQLHYAKSTLL